MIKDTTSTNVPIISCGEWNLYVEASVTSANESTGVQVLSIKFWIASILWQPFSITLSAVAEYWTTLPPKAVLEKKIRSILAEAQERLERRKQLPKTESAKQIAYFYEPKDDVDD